MKVILTDEAVQDLRDLNHFMLIIQKVPPVRVATILDAIIESLDVLETDGFTAAGRVFNEKDPNMLQWVIPKAAGYMALYLIDRDADAIVVTAIRDGRQDGYRR